MSKFVLAISGSPGTGKTTLAESLKKEDFFRLDLHRHYKEISTNYNRSKMCYDVDMKKFKALVKKEIKKHERLVVDSHISHLLPKKWVDLCVILTCSNLKKLKKRLERKKYSKSKVRENLDAEIFQICLVEAEEKGHNVVVFDTSRRTDKNILEEVGKLVG